MLMFKYLLNSQHLSASNRSRLCRYSSLYLFNYSIDLYFVISLLYFITLFSVLNTLSIFIIISWINNSISNNISTSYSHLLNSVEPFKGIRYSTFFSKLIVYPTIIEQYYTIRAYHGFITWGRGVWPPVVQSTLGEFHAWRILKL